MSLQAFLYSHISHTLWVSYLLPGLELPSIGCWRSRSVRWALDFHVQLAIRCLFLDDLQHCTLFTFKNEAGHVLSSASYPQRKVSSPMRFPSHSWLHSFSRCPSCGVFANTNLFSESAATALPRNMLDTQVLEPQLRPTESVHVGAGPGISI